MSGERKVVTKMKVVEPENVKATMEITLSVKDWERLSLALARDKVGYDWPFTDLRDIISETTQNVRATLGCVRNAPPADKSEIEARRT